MSIQDFGTIEANASLKQVIDALADLQDTLNFLLNGNLDVKNVRAQSITADRLKVTELSAISANLGHITAGLIEAVQIFGSYIATSTGYPRTEMSTTGNQFAAYQTANSYVKMNPASSASNPGFNFRNGVGHDGLLYMLSTDLYMATVGGSANIQISSGIDLFLTASNALKLNGTSLTMNGLTGYTGSFSVVTGVNFTASTTTSRTVTVTNGIVTSVV